MWQIKFLLALVTLLAISPISHAQTPHTWLEQGTPDGAHRALVIMKKDPSWVNRVYSNHQTPLHVAARYEHTEVVKWLLENGADINARAYNNFTPLCVTDSPEIINLILARNPDLVPLAQAIRELRHFTEFTETPQRKLKADNLRKIVEMYVTHLGDEIDLVSAIRLGQSKRVEEIIGQDPKMASDPAYGRRALREAANWGQLEICRFLIEKHNVNVNDFQGGSGYPIVKDALKHPDIVELLVNHNVDLKTRISYRGAGSGVAIIGDNATALHFAAAGGHPGSINHLIDGGVHYLANTMGIREGKEQEQTALDVAAAFGRTDNFKALLANDDYLAAVKNCKGLLDRVQFRAIASINGFRNTAADPAEMIRVLIQNGANPGATVRGTNLIQFAASEVHPTQLAANEKLASVATLLEREGVEMDLYASIAFSNIDRARQIVQAGAANVNARRYDGYPALHLAIAMNKREFVELLLANGGDVNIRNQSTTFSSELGGSLQCSIFWQHTELTELLISLGADVNAADKRGNTPLHAAVRRNLVEAVQLLLRNGAVKDVKNEAGKMPSDFASSEIKAILK